MSEQQEQTARKKEGLGSEQERGDAVQEQKPDYIPILPVLIFAIAFVVATLMPEGKKEELRATHYRDGKIAVDSAISDFIPLAGAFYVRRDEGRPELWYGSSVVRFPLPVRARKVASECTGEPTYTVSVFSGGRVVETLEAASVNKTKQNVLYIVEAGTGRIIAVQGTVAVESRSTEVSGGSQNPAYVLSLVDDGKVVATYLVEEFVRERNQVRLQINGDLRAVYLEGDVRIEAIER